MLPGTRNPPSDIDRGPSAVISRLAGTNLGDMTAAGFGGLAAAFDGTTSQAGNNCAAKIIAVNNVAWIVKSFAAPTAMDDSLIYGSYNQGFIVGNTGGVTIQRYGKIGSAPVNSTDGVLVGTLTFSDTNNESAGRLIPCTDKLTYFDHGWYRISITQNATLLVAECVFKGWQ